MTRRYHLHLPGIVYLGLTLMVALAAMNSQNNLLFWVFGIMLAAMVISGLVSGMMMLQLRFKRLDPQFGAVGEPLLVRYALTNTSRFLPAFNIHIAEQPHSADNTATSWQRLMAAAGAWIMHVGPGQSVHGEAVFWPTRRGEATFDRARLYTTFPFGIVKKSVTFSQPQHTLIYPQLFALRSDVLQTIAPSAPLGARTTERPGAGDDYYGLREHRGNESVRSIAWKRSAQLDQIVCIDRSTPSPPRLRIVLNLSRPTETLRIGVNETFSARDLEERAISLAASIAHAAHQEGFEIGLSAPGTRTPTIALRRSYWHVRKIMAALAAINLDAPRRQVVRHPVLDAERAWVVVIHPDRVEPFPGSRSETMHLTARQLDSLTVGPIGWDPLHMVVAGTVQAVARDTSAEAAA